MFAHNLKVTEIAKRDQIWAWCKKPCKLGKLSFEEGDCIQAHGHYMYLTGPYVGLEKKNHRYLTGRYDVVLKFEDWTITTLVKVEKQ